MPSPSRLLLLYRAREVHWRAFVVGVGVAALLLAPWLSRQVTAGFADVSALASGGAGEAESLPEPGSADAVRQSIRLTGIGDWEYVAADSIGPFATDAGLAWKTARGASMVATALLVVGLFTSALCIGRRVRTSRRWPWLDLGPRAASRALLLVWLAGVWFANATPATDRLFPHYLIVTFPVTFVVQVLALADLVAVARRSARKVALVGAISALVFLATGYAAFTLSFHRFLDDVGGTAGDYGVVYRDKAGLADLVRARGLQGGG